MITPATHAHVMLVKRHYDSIGFWRTWAVPAPRHMYTGSDLEAALDAWIAALSPARTEGVA